MPGSKARRAGDLGSWIVNPTVLRLISDYITFGHVFSYATLSESDCRK